VSRELAAAALSLVLDQLVAGNLRSEFDLRHRLRTPWTPPIPASLCWRRSCSHGLLDYPASLSRFSSADRALLAAGFNVRADPIP